METGIEIKYRLSYTYNPFIVADDNVQRLQYIFTTGFQEKFHGIHYYHLTVFKSTIGWVLGA